ncbi:MAG: hypothetical protein WC219_01415 [Acholeplasmataceae bacterium]
MNTPSNVIALASLVIAIAAVLITIFINKKNNKISFVSKFDNTIFSSNAIEILPNLYFSLIDALEKNNKKVANNHYDNITKRLRELLISIRPIMFISDKQYKKLYYCLMQIEDKATILFEKDLFLDKRSKELAIVISKYYSTMLKLYK